MDRVSPLAVANAVIWAEAYQYTSIRFTETVILKGLTASIGSVGDAYDNAAAETVTGLYKNEAIRKGSPFWVGPLKTIADVEEITFDWVNWYNNDRLHGYLGNIPPEEYETNYYAQNQRHNHAVTPPTKRRHENRDGSSRRETQFGLVRH